MVGQPDLCTCVSENVAVVFTKAPVVMCVCECVSEQCGCVILVV